MSTIELSLIAVESMSRFFLFFLFLFQRRAPCEMGTPGGSPPVRAPVGSVLEKTLSRLKHSPQGQIVTVESMSIPIANRVEK